MALETAVGLLVTIYVGSPSLDTTFLIDEKFQEAGGNIYLHALYICTILG